MTRHTKRLGMVALLSVVLGVGTLFAGCDKAPQDKSKPVTQVETRAPVEPSGDTPAVETSQLRPDGEDGAADPKQDVTDVLPVVSEGLVLHLAFDDCAPSPTILDSSVNQRHHVFVDGTGDANTEAHSVPGRFGKALAFDGKDDRVALDAASYRDVLGEKRDFTLAIWWRTSAPDPAKTLYFLSNYAATENSLTLYTVDRRVFCTLRYPTTPNRSISKGWTGGADGNWHHYAITRKGTLITIYHDGVPALTDDHPENAQSLTPADKALTIASASSGGAASPGQADDFRIYDQALSELDIQTLGAIVPALVAEIEAANDFVSLHALEKECGQREGQSNALTEAIDDRFEALTDGIEPQTLTEGLDFIDVNVKATGDKEYTFSFLLKSTAVLDTDYHLTFVGKVDESHILRLPENVQKLGRQTWAIVIKENPTSTWKPGEYHVLQKKVKTEFIPYDLSITLELRDTSTPGNKSLGSVGNWLKLGWVAGVAE